MRLAIFDLDETILARDSDMLWGEFLIEQGIIDSDSFLSSRNAMYEQYLRGNFDFPAYVKLSFSSILHLPQDEIDRLRNRFVKEKIIPQIQSKAQEAIEAHRQIGDYCMIITATLAYCIQPVSDHLSMHHLIGTEVVRDNEKITTQIYGTPSFAAGKVERLLDWMADKPYSLKGSHFYSDSHNDIPLLELVDHPFAVDPDARLHKHASEKGWPIISFK